MIPWQTNVLVSDSMFISEKIAMFLNDIPSLKVYHNNYQVIIKLLLSIFYSPKQALFKLVLSRCDIKRITFPAWDIKE